MSNFQYPPPKGLAALSWGILKLNVCVGIAFGVVYPLAALGGFMSAFQSESTGSIVALIVASLIIFAAGLGQVVCGIFWLQEVGKSQHTVSNRRRKAARFMIISAASGLLAICLFAFVSFS